MLTIYQTKKKLACSKLKAFADNKLNFTQKLEFVFSRVENIVGKQENAEMLLPAFSLFPKCF